MALPLVAVGAGATKVGHLAYVANSGSNTVSVIDTDTNTVVATVPLGYKKRPIQVAITPDGAFAYVTNSYYQNGNSVSVIDTQTNTVIATVPVGRSPVGWPSRLLTSSHDPPPETTPANV